MLIRLSNVDDEVLDKASQCDLIACINFDSTNVTLGIGSGSAEFSSTPASSAPAGGCFGANTLASAGGVTDDNLRKNAHVSKCNYNK